MLGFQHDRILMYHGTPRRDAAALERQLRLVRLAFPVVPLFKLASGSDAGGNRRARVALTFDDGLRNNIDVAYPILRKLDLTATFFVCPGLIETDSWLWNHEARQRLLSLDAHGLVQISARIGAPIDGVEPIVEWMKTLKVAQRRSVEKAIREATPAFEPTAEQREEFDLASWEELRRLDPKTVTIGSHTMTHPILTSLDNEETEAETRDSRFALEQRLDREVSIFCYPNGDLNNAVVASARRYYRSAVTTEAGRLEGAVDPHRMPRYSATPGWNRRLARRMVLG
ncbi:MAG TPA: polysaccharide deacetylase family protein [Burkholderiales bacterium]|nr:polysaccharide deacetylase family protein [Burkholderiales bacterium]